MKRNVENVEAWDEKQKKKSDRKNTIGISRMLERTDRGELAWDKIL